MITAEIWEYTVNVRVQGDRLIEVSQVHTNTFKREKSTLNASDMQVLRRDFIDSVAREITSANKREEALGKSRKKTVIKKLIVKNIIH